MKSKEILRWIVNYSVNGEYLDIADIPEYSEQTEDWWNTMFGMSPEKTVPKGKYLFYYSSNVGELIFGKEPDFTIVLPNEYDSMYGMDIINFYKIDD